jgi:hypothetical protein
MHAVRSARLSPILRRLRSVWRTALHSLALTAGLMASGIVPAGLAGSNEAESAPFEGSGSQYAEINVEARAQLRRPASIGHETCTVSSLLPLFARRPTRAAAFPLRVTRVSAGLTVPLRC